MSSNSEIYQLSGDFKITCNTRDEKFRFAKFESKKKLFQKESYPEAP